MTKEIELLTKILDWYSDENREFSIFEAEKLVKEYAKEKIIAVLSEITNGKLAIGGVDKYIYEYDYDNQRYVSYTPEQVYELTK